MVIAGWDRPLQGFYMMVLYTDTHGQDEYAFNNLSTQTPHPPQFEDYVLLLKDMGIELPKGMADDIIADGRANMGNKVRHWPQLPPDPEKQNGDRAKWAKVSVCAFQNVTGTDDEDAIADLLADIMHLCDRETDTYSTFDDAMRRAQAHYIAETMEEPHE